MQELKTNVFVTDNDNEVLSLMDSLKKEGVKIPDFDLTKDNHFFFVSYKSGFNLHIISYFNMPGDSGYTAFHVKNFLTENKFNLLEFIPMLRLDVSKVMTFLTQQTMGIAKKINYPFSISMVMDKDFIGLIATPTHPLTEILNKDGSKN